MLTKKGLIQIAGVHDIEEAAMLQDKGVRYIGFPLRTDVNKEDISEKEARDIIVSLLPGTRAVIITYISEAHEVSDLCRSLSASIVQLHGDPDLYNLKELKQISPDLTLIKSLVVGYLDRFLLEKIVEEQSEFVDAFITDTYNPVTKARGATGITHDWEISRRIVEFSPRPVILAGGLNPKNVGDAIMTVKPCGVDCHTGVEGADGRKDPEKVAEFVSEAGDAFRKLKYNTL